MNAGTATFIVVLALIGTFGWLMSKLRNNWVKARQSDGAALAADRKVELLSAENAHLKRQIGRLEERLAVLERIATDPAGRTAQEIEDLRRNAD